MKCLSKESPLALRLAPHPRHLARLSVASICRLHSHLPRKSLLHALQHHFFRTLLNTGEALLQLSSGVGEGSGGDRQCSRLDEGREGDCEDDAGERRSFLVRQNVRLSLITRQGRNIRSVRRSRRVTSITGDWAKEIHRTISVLRQRRAHKGIRKGLAGC